MTILDYFDSYPSELIYGHLLDLGIVMNTMLGAVEQYSSRSLQSNEIDQENEPFALQLYKLNLKEFLPKYESNYRLSERNRASYLAQREAIETAFLEEVKSPQIQTLPKDMNDKDALFNVLQEHILLAVDNSYVDWFETSATLEDAKNFVNEYGADQVYFTQYLSQLAAIAPEKAAIEIYSNLFDETGLDISNRESLDISLSHTQIFRRLYGFFSLPSVDRFHSTESFNSETYYCISMMLLSLRLGYLQGAGALFLLECSIPEQLCKINRGLKRLGVPENERLFLDMHCELDKHHAANWWKNAIKDYLVTEKHFYDLLLGIDIAISARNQLWNGLYNQAKK